MYLGDYILDATLYFSFTTRSFTTGAPTQLAGTPAISVYKDADDTQTTTGVTLAVDDDGITGWNRVTIDTSDAFYTTATDFQVVITTGTVGGVSVVGEAVAHFSIENRSALRPTVASRTLDVAAGGEAGIDWGNVANPTSTVGLSGTTVGIVTLVNGLADGVITAAKFAANAITSTVIADGALTSAKAAAGFFDAVWSVATRTLTSFGTLVADVADAVWNEARADHTAAGSFGEGVASVQGDVTGNVDGSVDSVTQGVAVAVGGIDAASFAAAAIDAAALAPDAVDEIWDESMETGATARQSMRLANSANGAKLSGAATTTVAIRDLADSKDRVTATVDADGNRTAVVRDLT